MRALTKNFTALCLLLTAWLTSQAAPTIRQTQSGFQVLLDEAADTWSPEIYGEPWSFNSDNSAVIVGWGNECAVVRIVDGKQIGCAQSRFFFGCAHFSEKGEFVYFYNDKCIFVSNIKSGLSFMIPGGRLVFDDKHDDFVFLHHMMRGEYERCVGWVLSIFNAADGHYITSIPGRYTYISPYSSVLLLGRDNSENEGPLKKLTLYVEKMDEDALRDPRLINIAGQVQLIARLKGTNPQFSPDGQFVLMQQCADKENCKSEPCTAVYSTTTGKLVRTLPGHFGGFADQGDVVCLCEPVGAFRMSDGEPV